MTSPTPRALFVCDGSPTVGGGHVMRALTLAGALAERGWRSTFLADPFVEVVLARHDALGVRRVAGADQAPDTLVRQAAACRGYDAVIVDHFGMSAPHEQALRAVAPLLAVVDDLADRPHDCDLLIDCNLQRTAADYLRLTPSGADLLLGARYAPVRPAFAAAREAALDRRARGAPATRILVSLGLTDVGGVTGQVVDAVLRATAGLRIDVVVGREAPSLPKLLGLEAEGAAITLHSDVDGADMAAMMAQADLAIGAGGSSAWERVVLGLPTLALVLAPNQRPGTEALAAAGAVVALDDLSALPGALARLLADRPARTAISQAAAALCDGLGASRSAARIDVRSQTLRS